MYQSIRVSEYQVSNIFQVLHLVTVSGHDMEGLGRLTYCHRKCFHGERLPATNKAVTIAGRAGTGLALPTFLSSDCCSVVLWSSQWEVTITILRIISIQSLTPISSLGRKMRGSAKYFPRENVRIIY